MKSLLANITRDQVQLEPFPFLFVKNVLPDDVCQQLIKEFPPVSVLAKDRKEVPENTRLDYTISDVRNDSSQISTLWQEFMEANAGEEFVADIFRLFGPEIKTLYPQYAEYVDNGSAPGSGIRVVDQFDENMLLADANIGANTPITSGQASSVRTAHVDDPRKLWAGLFYLRHPEDTSEGAEFVIYKYKDGVTPTFTRQQINMNDVEEVVRVPYQTNTLVLFLNSFNAVHGVTPRGVAPHTRMFLNIVGEAKDRHFEIAQYQEQGLRKFARRVLNKFGIGMGGVEQRK